MHRTRRPFDASMFRFSAARRFVSAYRARHSSSRCHWKQLIRQRFVTAFVQSPSAPGKAAEAASPSSAEPRRVAHPGARSGVGEYMRLVDGQRDVVGEDESGLPPVEELATRSQTVTLHPSDRGAVIADLFAARQA